MNLVHLNVTEHLWWADIESCKAFKWPIHRPIFFISLEMPPPGPPSRRHWAVLAQQPWGCNAVQAWWSWRPTIAHGRLLSTNNIDDGHTFFCRTGGFFLKCYALYKSTFYLLTYLPSPAPLRRTAAGCSCQQCMHLSKNCTSQRRRQYTSEHSRLYKITDRVQHHLRVVMMTLDFSTIRNSTKTKVIQRQHNTQHMIMWKSERTLILRVLVCRPWAVT